MVILSTEGWEDLGEDSCWATGRVKRHLINEDVAKEKSSLPRWRDQRKSKEQGGLRRDIPSGYLT